MAEAKKLLAESGYDGTPVVVMAPGDVMTLKAQPIVAAQLLRDAGFKVDVQATDWQTVVTRRASQKPPKEGGWNMFFTNWVAPTSSIPLLTCRSAARARAAAGSDGRMIPKWKRCAMRLRAPLHPKNRRSLPTRSRRKLRSGDLYSARPISRPGAWRTSLKGVLDGPATPIFWNIDKSE